MKSTDIGLLIEPALELRQQLWAIIDDHHASPTYDDLRKAGRSLAAMLEAIVDAHHNSIEEELFGSSEKDTPRRE